MSTAVKVTIVAALAAAVLAVFAMKNQPDPALPEKEQSSTQSTLADPKVKSLPRLLDLGADKCIPCKMMQPVLADLSKTYKGKLKVDFIDVWKNPAAGEQYRIESIPTQIFFDAKGKELYRHVGFYSKDDIVAMMKELKFGL